MTSSNMDISSQPFYLQMKTLLNMNIYYYLNKYNYQVNYCGLIQVINHLNNINTVLLLAGRNHIFFEYFAIAQHLLADLTSFEPDHPAIH